VRAQVWLIRAVPRRRASRAETLLNVLRENGLEPERLRMVHPWPGAETVLALVEAVKGGREGLAVLPPFFICQEKGGAYTPEMAAMYAG